MATALYRRYRPESFAEVIGQDHVTEPIRRALKSGRIGHAYLFSGPRGCGKTTSARILARCLNCAEGPTDTPCGICDSCRDLARGGTGSLDVVEIDAASHGGVDDARDLRERAAFAPVRDRFKVFIIDEAHMVTSAGFNALLKLVEEPPEHVKFVFATTEPDKVIGTIRSRTHHYPFRLIPPQILIPYLEEICREENVTVANGVLALATRAGGGSARDTLSVLDQLIAGSDERGVELEVATNLLGFTDVELMNRAIDAVALNDAAALFTAVDEVIGSGHEPRRFVEDLLERFRDLIVVVAAPERSRELLPDMPVDQVERLGEQAQKFEPRTLTDCAQVVSEALNSMVGATSPRLHLELLAARLLLRGAPVVASSAGANGAGAGSMQDTGQRAAAGSSSAGSDVGQRTNAGSPARSDQQHLTPRQRAELAARGSVAAAKDRRQREEAGGWDRPVNEEPSNVAIAGAPQADVPREPRNAAQAGGQNDSQQEKPHSPTPQQVPVTTDQPSDLAQSRSPHADSWGDALNWQHVSQPRRKDSSAEASSAGHNTPTTLNQAQTSASAATWPDSSKAEPGEGQNSVASSHGAHSRSGGSGQEQPSVGTQVQEQTSAGGQGNEQSLAGGQGNEQPFTGASGQANASSIPDQYTHESVEGEGPVQSSAAVSSGTPHAMPTTQGDASIEDIRGHWSALMDTLQSLKRASWALIAQNAGVYSFDGSVLVLNFQSQGLVNAFYRGSHAQVMAQAVKKIMRLDVAVEATSGGETASGNGNGGTGPGGAGANWGSNARGSVTTESDSGTDGARSTVDSGNATAAGAPNRDNTLGSASRNTPAHNTSNDQTRRTRESHSSSQTNTAEGRWGDAIVDGQRAWDEPPPDPYDDPYYEPHPHNAHRDHQTAEDHASARQQGVQPGTGSQGHSATQLRDGVQTQAERSPHDNVQRSIDTVNNIDASSAPDSSKGDTPVVGTATTAQELATSAPDESSSPEAEVSELGERAAAATTPTSTQTSGASSEESLHLPAARGNVLPVSIPPQPSGSEPRTHGQEELREAMRKAYAASDFVPAETLIEVASDAHVGASNLQQNSQDTAWTPPAGSDDPPSAGAPLQGMPHSDEWSGSAAAAGHTDEWGGSIIADTPGDGAADSWDSAQANQSRIQRKPASQSHTARNAESYADEHPEAHVASTPHAEPHQESAQQMQAAASPDRTQKLSGAALARQALHDAQAKASENPRTYPSDRSRDTRAVGAANQSNNGEADSDPFGGASLDDADATSIDAKRRPGRDVLEEFLGAEVLEVIDEMNGPGGY